MKIIEISYLEEEDVDTVDELIIDEIEGLKLKNQVFFSIFGANEDFERILSKITKKGISEANALFFGKIKYKDEELCVIYMLLAIYKEYDYFVRLNLLDGTSKKIDKSNINTDLWKKLDSIRTNSVSGDIYTIKNELKDLKNSIKNNYLLSFASPIINSITLMQNLVDCEIDLYTAPVLKGYVDIISGTEIDEFKNYSLFPLLEKYEKLNASFMGYGIRIIKNRVDYISAAGACEKKLLQALNDKRLPELFIWFATYFVLCGLFYKRLNNYSAGISMLIRSFEMFNKAILISKGSGDYNNKGEFIIAYEDEYQSLRWRKTNGVGPLWEMTKLHIRPAENEKVIWNSISLRNRSVFGHGINLMNEEHFDYVYKNITSLIKSTPECNANGKGLWSGLLDLGLTKVYSDISSQLAFIALSDMGLS